jgi:hypothetical protein
MVTEVKPARVGKTLFSPHVKPLRLEPQPPTP